MHTNAIIIFFILNFFLTLYHIQINHIQASCFLDIYTIDTHEGINNQLSSVGGDWIAKRVSYDFYLHSRLDAYTISIICTLGCDYEGWHNIEVLINPRIQQCLRLTKESMGIL